MNLSTMVTYFRTLTGDADGEVWSTDTLWAWANDAVRHAARRTGAIEKRTQLAVTASTAVYDLPADCDTLIRAAFDGVRLKPILLSLLRLENADHAETTGTPFVYYLDELNQQIGLHYTPADGTSTDALSGEYGILKDPDSGTMTSEWGVLLSPLDSTTYTTEWGDIGEIGVISGNDLELFYRVMPTDMDSGDDEPDLPAWAHGLVLFWMLKRAYQADTVLRDFATADFWGALAERQIMRLAVRSFGKLPKVWQQQKPYGSEESPSVEHRQDDENITETES